MFCFLSKYTKSSFSENKLPRVIKNENYITIYMRLFTTKESCNWWITRRELGFRQQISEANNKKRWSQISGSTQENFAGAQNGCEMISQPSCLSAKFRSHFVHLRNSPKCFQIFATDSFRFFSSDICCLIPHSNPPIIGFLS